MVSLPLMFSKENTAHETIALSNAPPPDPPSSPKNNEAPEILLSSSTSAPSFSSTAQEGTQKAVLAPLHPTSEGAGRSPQVEIERAEGGVAGGVFKFDALSPMVVNSNGTLSRITNWKQLSEGERERTVRLLVKKGNLVRLVAQSDSLSPPSTPPLPSPSLSQDPSVAPSKLPPATAPPSRLPPASSTSNSFPPPYPFQTPEIEAHPHSQHQVVTSATEKSSNHKEKEGVQGATGTMVDPHGSGQLGSRGIEEKTVDLLGEVEKDEKGEAGSGGGEGEVKAEDGSGEGRRVNVVSLGETDVETLR